MLRRARHWLQNDLTLWKKELDGGKPDDVSLVGRTLQSWEVNSALACVRDSSALAKLPVEEQDGWCQLWAEVDATLKKAQLRQFLQQTMPRAEVSTWLKKAQEK